jgi:hypothetical protein
MGTPWRRRHFPTGAWETAVMRQSVRQTRARRADRKSRPAIFYVEGLTSFDIGGSANKTSAEQRWP